MAVQRRGFCLRLVFRAPEEQCLVSVTKTTLVHEEHAPLQCQEQICGFLVFFCCYFSLALRRSALQKTCLQVFSGKGEVP